MRTEFLVVGGGLSGLALAAHLAELGRSFLLVEARDRFGGRIVTELLDGGYFDLGPAWFWSGQPRIEALINAHGLRRFEQHAQGDLSFEDEHGAVQRGVGFASMQGSYRLEGGLQALVSALHAALPASCIRNSTPITSLKRTADGVKAESSSGEAFQAQKVFLTLPPRVAAKLIFEPELSPSAIGALNAIPTWMAGQAKAVAVYGQPFWRNAGLSGDAMSRHGPMVEIHDASPANGGPFALFGFLGIPPQARADEASLRNAIVAQLERLFGSDAAQPKALFVKDWAADLFTATEHDLHPVHTHPRYGLPQELRNLWDGRLLLAGTEVASQFGGFLEGALEAAENALALLEPMRA